jgi:hypothetical protein
MTVETDALADAAERFSEAIRAERLSTFDALANERQAALQIIESLRQERGRRLVSANNRFAVGVVLGLAVGAAVIYAINQRVSEEARLGLTAGPAPDVSGPAITNRLKSALSAGKRAAQRREDELWENYHSRVKTQDAPAQGDGTYSI